MGVPLVSDIEDLSDVVTDKGLFLPRYSAQKPKL